MRWGIVAFVWLLGCSSGSEGAEVSRGDAGREAAAIVDSSAPPDVAIVMTQPEASPTYTPEASTPTPEASTPEAAAPEAGVDACVYPHWAAQYCSVSGASSFCPHAAYPDLMMCTHGAPIYPPFGDCEGISSSAYQDDYCCVASLFCL